MPTISLAMIVKNEEATLARAITSAAPWVDEVVVVDTGSTDGSVEVASTLGARVIRHAWDGFAPARNRALAACTGKWVLALDADEELDEAAGPRIRELAEAGGLVGYYVLQRNYVPGSPPGDVPVVRLFPNRADVRFRGVLHERIACDDPAFRRAHSGIVVHHWGAPSSHDPLSEKHRWYESLLVEAHAQAPDDPEILMFLGLMRHQRGAHADAIGLLLRCQQLAPPRWSSLPGVFEMAAVCLYRLGAYEEAMVQCRRGLAIAPDFPPLHYNLGLCAWKLGLHEEARRHALAAIAAAESYQGDLPVDPRIKSSMAAQLIAACEAPRRDGA